MVCPNCKKSMTPLELFNGTIKCSKCRKDLLTLSGGELEINANNHTSFMSAEYLYHEALREKNKKKFEDNIKLAFDLYMESANNNNPYAIVRLGYLYDKGYAKISEVERVMFASKFYNIILDYTSDFNAVDVPVVPKRIMELKEEVANLKLDMLASMDLGASSNKASDEYNYYKVKQSLESRFGFEFEPREVKSVEISADIQIENLIKMCTKKTSKSKNSRKPLMIINHITFGDLKKFVKRINNYDDSRETNAIYQAINSISYFYLINESLDDDDPDKIKNLKMKTTINEFVDDSSYKYDDKFVLYIFNAVNGINKLSGVELRRRVVGNKNIIKKIIPFIEKNINVNFTFYEDDILAAGGFKRKAIDQLLEMAN